MERGVSYLGAGDHADRGVGRIGEISKGADSSDTLDLVLFL